jgi:hypothetical protein
MGKIAAAITGRYRADIKPFVANRLRFKGIDITDLVAPSRLCQFISNSAALSNSVMS